MAEKECLTKGLSGYQGIREEYKAETYREGLSARLAYYPCRRDSQACLDHLGTETDTGQSLAAAKTADERVHRGRQQSRAPPWLDIKPAG